MKKISLVILTGVFLAFNSYAQQVNIVVAIAEETVGNCNSSDLGYQLYAGQQDAYDLLREATAKVKRDYPNHDSVDSKDNIDWGTYMGDYIVIISGITRTSECGRFTYGIGYGTNYDNALSDAKRSLGSRNWSWSESRHGYKLEHSQRY